MTNRLGFSLEQRGLGDWSLTYLQFRFLVEGREHLYELRVDADPDFTVIQLRQLADAIARVAHREDCDETDNTGAISQCD